MNILLNIENDLGRQRKTSESYIDRNIDIDILLFDDEIIFSKSLIVPLQAEFFALEGLSQLLKTIERVKRTSTDPGMKKTKGLSVR